MKPLPDLDPLLDWNDPAGTEERVLALLETLGDPTDAGYLAEVYSQVARARGLQGKFDDGHRWIRKGEASGGDLPPRARVRLLLERGRLHNSAGDPGAARPLFERAWELARQADQDGLAVDAAHMLAIVAAGDEALEWNRRALDLAEASADPAARRWRASLYNNLAWTYHDRGDFAQALELFQRAVPLRWEMGQQREHRIARWSVGRALRSLGRLREALALHRELERESLDRGEEPDGYGLEEIAECLYGLGEGSAARPYFAAAHARLSQDDWLVRNEPERLERLKALGET